MSDNLPEKIKKKKEIKPSVVNPGLGVTPPSKGPRGQTRMNKELVGIDENEQRVSDARGFKSATNLRRANEVDKLPPLVEILGWKNVLLAAVTLACCLASIVILFAISLY